MPTEHLVDVDSIEPMFNPRSIAIIGASADFNKPSGRPVNALLCHGYKGRIIPVNPRYTDIAGLTCYPSLRDVPGEVDLVIIGVPARMIFEALEQCAEKKVKGVIIFTSGFAEVGPEGQEEQRQLTEFARRTGIRLCGPNCLGILHLENSVMASFANIVDLPEVYPRLLGFVTQSGAYGAMIYKAALERGVGFSCFVSVGNEADLQFADYVGYLLGDKETKVIGGYVEGIKDGLKLRQVAERALLVQKPLVVIKVGRTRAGSRAASSHTGSLAGDDQVYDSFFRQMGIIRIETLEDLTAFVTMFRSGRMPRSNRVAIMSGSGGAGVVMTDKSEQLGLEVPEITGETRQRLESYLPFFASAKNPVDLTAQAAVDPELFAKCLKELLLDDQIDMVILHFGFSDEHGLYHARQLIDLYNSTTKPIIGAFFEFTNSEHSRQAMQMVKDAGIPVVHDDLQSVGAAARLAYYADRLRHRALDREASVMPAKDLDSGIKSLLQSPQQITEYQSKLVLKAADIPVTREVLCISPEAAVTAAREIGYPVVLKVQSPEIMHKTESGGLMLNLKSDGEVAGAYRQILANVEAYAPGADIHGVLVQEMLGEGTEVIVGCTRDPAFGPVIMFGLGGIFVEALKDVSFRVAPLSRADAEEMIKEVKAYSILKGLRGQPPADVKAIVDVLMKVSQLVVEMGDNIDELDINPLIVFPQGKGIKAVDALIVKKPGETQSSSGRPLE
ncbi:MAG: acetate--CoA ligase family protein [Bacillota bacterium]